MTQTEQNSKKQASKTGDTVLPNTMQTVEGIKRRITEELIPGKQIDNFVKYALPSLQEAGKLDSLEDWELLQNSLTIVPEEYRSDFAKGVLTPLAKTGELEKPDDWHTNTERFVKTLEEIPERFKQSYTSHDLPNMILRGEFEWNTVSEQLSRARDYVIRHGYEGFIWETALTNLGELQPVDSPGHLLKLRKGGSTMQVYDGQQFGKIERTVSKRAFHAWTKAIEAGIACEEIDMEGGEYAASESEDDQMIVRCLLVGEDLIEFFRNPENEKYRQDIREQVKVIEQQLKQNSIFHQDLKDNNFVVRLENSRPKVRVIDFDLATVLPQD